MDCRIDVTHQAEYNVVRVIGRLTDAQVPDLLRVCATVEPVRLDLTELDSANGVGIEALKRLHTEGAEIVGATHFIQLLLDAHPFSRE
jgi:hypothetical protein